MVQYSSVVVSEMKCLKSHLLRKSKSVSGISCRACNASLIEDAEVYRCAPCDFDVCAACFKKADVKSHKSLSGAVPQVSKQVSNKFDKPKAGQSSASKSAASGGGLSVKADPRVLSAAEFAAAGFPGGSAAAAAPAQISSSSLFASGTSCGDFTQAGFPGGAAGPSNSLGSGLPLGIPAMPCFGSDLSMSPRARDQPRDAPGTPLDEMLAKAASIRSALMQTVPRPPDVDDSLVGEARDAAEKASADFQPSNKDLMTALSAILKNMVVKDDVRAEVTEAMVPVKKELREVSDRTDLALSQTHNLHSRLVTVEQGQVIQHDRVGKLQAEVSELRAQIAAGSAGFRRDKFDPALCRVAFTQWPEGTSNNDKVAAMQRFMSAQFPGVNVVYYDHFNGKASFAHLGTPSAAKTVAEQSKGKSLEGLAGVKVKPAVTAVDLSRNWALYKAQELISKDSELRGRSVEVKKGKDRGVYVNGVAAFSQAVRYDPHGCFVNEFVHLKLP